MNLFEKEFKEPISRIRQGDKIICQKEYNVSGIKILISVDECEHDSTKVFSEHCRMERNVNGIRSVVRVTMDKTHFFREIEFLIKEIDGKNIEQQVMWDAYAKLLTEHIEYFGRLVDGDYQGYIDRILILTTALLKANQSLPKTPSMINKECEESRELYIKYTHQYCFDYIWISYREPGMNFWEQSKLKKLSDFK